MRLFASLSQLLKVKRAAVTVFSVLTFVMLVMGINGLCMMETGILESIRPFPEQ